MTYVTSIERLAREEGREEGLTALRASVLRVLERRFGAVPPELAGRLGDLDDVETLRDLVVEAATTDSLHSFSLTEPAR